MRFVCVSIRYHVVKKSQAKAVSGESTPNPNPSWSSRRSGVVVNAVYHVSVPHSGWVHGAPPHHPHTSPCPAWWHPNVCQGKAHQHRNTCSKSANRRLAVLALMSPMLLPAAWLVISRCLHWWEPLKLDYYCRNSNMLNNRPMDKKVQRHNSNNKVSNLLIYRKIPYCYFNSWRQINVASFFTATSDCASCKLFTLQVCVVLFFYFLFVVIVIWCFVSSGGGYSSATTGLDLKRHVEDQQRAESPLTDQENLQEPDVKRSRQCDTE